MSLQKPMAHCPFHARRSRFYVDTTTVLNIVGFNDRKDYPSLHSWTEAAEAYHFGFLCSHLVQILPAAY